MCVYVCVCFDAVVHSTVFLYNMSLEKVKEKEKDGDLCSSSKVSLGL